MKSESDIPVESEKQKFIPMVTYDVTSDGPHITTETARAINDPHLVMDLQRLFHRRGNEVNAFSQREKLHKYALGILALAVRVQTDKKGPTE